jgi:UDP-N-acetyl-D-mannosaminuronate dehydrogenase
MHFETATSTMGGNLSLDDHERINNLVKRAISYLSAVDREALVTQGQTSMFRAPVAIDGVESTRDVITTVATITTPADSVDVERLSQALRFLSEKLKFETCINALLESL